MGGATPSWEETGQAWDTSAEEEKSKQQVYTVEKTVDQVSLSLTSPPGLLFIHR